MPTNKSLGQHWLRDRAILAAIADAAELTPTDTVLEIGPGLGTLTSEILRQTDKVIAVEYDSELARKLPGQFPGKDLTVFSEVANVPYYITSKIIERLMTAPNKPSIAVLLVQKEVAQRIAARPGDMSILAVSAQLYAEASLGTLVPRRFFTPPPKVDSQVIVLRTRTLPLVPAEDERALFRVVKAGFRAKRKKLRSSISAGLAITKPAAEELLQHANIDPELRAEDLSIDDWLRLARDAV
ncbi:ribosomal RNA small subunit methyltransferase A [Candidatus Saccharibacteria bacterium 32-50-10]|nr:MAG: ribosomal RNA small subunit methyltransferase A [Candidatus Saccharibacteria bacterium 32-50-10]